MLKNTSKFSLKMMDRKNSIKSKTCYLYIYHHLHAIMLKPSLFSSFLVLTQPSMLALEFRQDLGVWFSQAYLIDARNCKKMKWKWLAITFLLLLFLLPPSFSSCSLLLLSIFSNFQMLSLFSLGQTVDLPNGRGGWLCFILFSKSCNIFQDLINAHPLQSLFMKLYVKSCLPTCKNHSKFPPFFGSLGWHLEDLFGFLEKPTKLLKEAQFNPNQMVPLWLMFSPTSTNSISLVFSCN